MVVITRSKCGGKFLFFFFFYIYFLRRASEDSDGYVPEVLEGHADWIRDVAWAPNIGLPFDTIASCSQDRTVIIWQRTTGNWTKAALLKFPAVVWRVSWSVTGNILAVSTADNQVTLWKDVEGKWLKLSSLTDQQQQQAAQKKPATAPQTM